MPRQYALFLAMFLFTGLLGYGSLAAGEESRTIGHRAIPVAHSSHDFARHIAHLKKKLDDDQFHFVVERPFVVAGNESKSAVRRRASSTVRWATERLKKTYFKKDPHHILTIWLLKDKKSYERLAKKLYGEEPGTPYGYYSPSDRALVMNISTGTGTLVHEIVHPFMEANFPECPSWLNEGLGSLYEQCGDRDGKITGFTNWRLAGLKQAIRTDSVPSFETLCETSRAEFYHADPGTNYAQARYLCYYLQEKGLLTDFYHRFHEDCHEDPTGLETLQSVLGRPNMKKFKKTWEKYVMKLRYP